ncbi:MAG TPA: sigma-70 family RNA polymerase sigma factor [Terracidiphilus sp.]|jgi:RNA polymerase sigma-70 factor (ECF subfamily)|nr:sigma-70 family RNA polymerase sigma factor [Terracidiphilus sp.]
MNDHPANPNRPAGRSFNRPPELDGSAGDESLLEQVRMKDQASMTALFDRYGSMVYSVALRVLKDPGAAEDVMQEVFFQVWQSPQAFVPRRGSLGAWLLVVTRNRAVDVLRRRKPSDSVDEIVLAASGNIAVETERRTMMEKVRSALNKLSPEQQQSIEMAFFEGLSHSQIAEQTGEPLGTVKTRIRSALISVRRAFQP